MKRESEREDGVNLTGCLGICCAKQKGEGVREGLTCRNVAAPHLLMIEKTGCVCDENENASGRAYYFTPCAQTNEKSSFT